MAGSGRIWWDHASKERYVSQATNDAWQLTHRSIAKQNSNNSPYLIANEWIASQVALLLRLPTPPSALTRAGTGHKGMFASLKYGTEDAQPDDCDPAACIRAMPSICTGILLFDILIANPDRHVGNVRVDTPRAPQQLVVIDHDRALFGIWEKEGLKRLKELRDRLGITGGSVTGQNRHCFLDLLDTDEFLEVWYDRINGIPGWFIEDVCNEVIQLPLTRDEVDAGRDFLIYRKDNLSKIVYAHRDEFKLLPKKLFDAHTAEE